jgi:hypothetical protein
MHPNHNSKTDPLDELLMPRKIPPSKKSEKTDNEKGQSGI